MCYNALHAIFFSPQRITPIRGCGSAPPPILNTRIKKKKKTKVLLVGKTPVLGEADKKKKKNHEQLAQPRNQLGGKTH